MRLTILGVGCLLAACGPSVPTSEGSGSGSGGATGSTRGSTGAGETSAPEPGSEAGGSTSFGSRYDLPPFEPVDVCGFVRPEACERTWPLEESLASGGSSTTWVEPGADPGSARVWYLDDPAPDAYVILSVGFELPCAPVEGETRYVLDAEVTQWAFGGFEWSQRSSYAGRIDVELLNECLHLRVHGVEVVDDQPLDGLGEVFEWDDLLRPGYLNAPW